MGAEQARGLVRKPIREPVREPIQEPARESIRKPVREPVRVPVQEQLRKPVATVTGIYRGTFDGLDPLTVDTPLTLDEVRRNPIFYELDLDPEQGDENLIIDIIYDNMSPMRMQDLFRGTDIPRGIKFWPDWFDIPPYQMMHDIDGRRVYPRAPGIHTVQIRTAPRKRSQIGVIRDFSPKNGGYTSPVFEFAIAADTGREG